MNGTFDSSFSYHVNEVLLKPLWGNQWERLFGGLRSVWSMRLGCIMSKILASRNIGRRIKVLSIL